MHIDIPYYRSFLPLDIEKGKVKDILVSSIHTYHTDKTQEALVEEALAHPLDTPPLHRLAKGKKHVLLITSDHTRAVPSKITLPILLREIRKENPSVRITILIATGLHRKTTEEEMRRMFGDFIVEHEEIVVHDAFDDSSMVSLGTLPSGNVLEINALATSCDLMVAEGFIEPHFFAGFSGGRKSVLPGICSALTVNENHSAKAIGNPHSAAGVLKGNVIHEDMVTAARRANLAFILNVALDQNKKIIAAFAGDMETAHTAGCRFVDDLSRVPAVKGDIVITSNGGYPLDQNVYQSPKAMATGAACCNPGGVIIMVASCCDGIGGTHFEKLMTSGTPAQIVAGVEATPPERTIPEQWCAQILGRILLDHPVILVSQHFDSDLCRKINMIPAASVAEALEIAYSMKGADASLVVVPDGVAVIAS